MKLKNITPYILFMFLGLSGCSILSNLDEITTLSDYSSEKDAQHRQAKIIDDHYNALLKFIDQGNISHYIDKTSFIHSFGEPILKKELSNGAERWLYRYAIYRLAKNKVYVYFDREGKMVKWEKQSCPKLF